VTREKTRSPPWRAQLEWTPEPLVNPSYPSLLLHLLNTDVTTRPWPSSAHMLLIFRDCSTVGGNIIPIGNNTKSSPHSVHNPIPFEMDSGVQGASSSSRHVPPPLKRPRYPLDFVHSRGLAPVRGMSGTLSPPDLSTGADQHVSEMAESPRRNETQTPATHGSTARKKARTRTGCWNCRRRRKKCQ
jgi:hypothetical protein